MLSYEYKNDLGRQEDSILTTGRMINLKNQKYFPFERNRYYYGKLLTSADFNAEQKYFNDKRRFVNRLMFGGGVIAGLNVIRTDDYSITIDAGAALDYSGREIVLESAVVKRFSAIKGYNSDEEATKFYVCIGYEEEEVEPVHSVGNVMSKAGESIEHNKYNENISIFLTEEEPDHGVFQIDNLNMITNTVFDGEGVYITLSIPSVISASDACNLILTVQKRLQENPVALSFRLQSNCITTPQGGAVAVSFNEKEFDKKEQYQVKIPVISQNAQSTDDRISIMKDSFRLQCGEKSSNASSEFAFPSGNVYPVRISVNSRIEELEKMFFMRPFEEHVKDTLMHRIYLARVILAKSGPSYVIDTIEKMPFDQYVATNRFERIVNRVLTEEQQKNRSQVNTNRPETVVDFVKTRPDQEQAERISATGTVEIYLGLTPRANQKFFTEEITHGLGDGPVSIVLGCEYDDGMDSRLSKDQQGYFGSADVFSKTPHNPAGPLASLGAVCYYKRGTFIIGAKLLANTGETVLKVRWLAYKDPKTNELEGNVSGLDYDSDKRVIIRPDTVQLAPRETIRFEASMPGSPDAHLIYSIVEPDGGTIDNNGIYQAPTQEGIYEIRVCLDKEKDIRTSALVIVKNNA